MTKTTFTLLLLCLTTQCAVHKILCGRTGNGKSYIASQLGCQSSQCENNDGSEQGRSCTKKIVSCPGLLDTVGLDDDGVHEIMFNGQPVTLSGFVFPIYNLFETLEERKISSAEFYFVIDANNVREGSSSKLFKKFLTEDLKCTYTRILNKYRESVHKTNKLPEDVIVGEFDTDIHLEGSVCKFGLDYNWRELIINEDLKAVRSMIDIENCEKLISRKKEFDAILGEKQLPLPTRKTPISYPKEEDCSYWVTTGRYCARRFLGICTKRRDSREMRTNEDCVRRRNEARDLVTTRNENSERKYNSDYEKVVAHNKDLKERQDRVRKTLIATIDEGLIECDKLINWKRDDEL